MTWLLNPDGILVLNSDGRVIITETQTNCCCSPAGCGVYGCTPISGIALPACYPLETQYDCICCQETTGNISITFGSFTQAANYQTDISAWPVVDDIVDKLSGQTISITLEYNNFVNNATRYGKISFIDTVNCRAYAWKLQYSSLYDNFTGRMLYYVFIDIVSAYAEYPWAIGDNFPCTNNNGTLTGTQQTPAPGGSTYDDSIATTVFGSPGNCCGPDPGMTLFVNSFAIDDSSPLEITGISFTSCGECDNSGYPSTVTADFSSCYPGIGTVTLNKIVLGDTDVAYDGNTSGTIGDYFYDITVFSLSPDGSLASEGCCFTLVYSVLVYDEDFNEIASCNGASSLCDNFNLIGTYTGDLSIDVS